MELASGVIIQDLLKSFAIQDILGEIGFVFEGYKEMNGTMQ